MGINRMEKDRSAAAVDSDEFYVDETKMEKFYELIRSFNEARANHQRNLQQFRNQDQVIHHSNGNNLRNDVNKGVKLSDNQATLIPSFKWEDFNYSNHEEQDQVVVSEKSGNDFLQNSSNFREIETDIIIDKYNKKRKINEVDDGGDSGGYGEKDDEMNNDDRLKVSRPQLDLNLAL